MTLVIDRNICQKMCGDSCLVPIFLSVLSPLWLDHLVWLMVKIEVRRIDFWPWHPWRLERRPGRPAPLRRDGDAAEHQVCHDGDALICAKSWCKDVLNLQEKNLRTIDQGICDLGANLRCDGFCVWYFFDCWLWTVSFWKVLAAESRAEQQMGRLRSELEQAELAAQAMDFLSERKKNITVGEEELLKCEKCDLNSPMTKGWGSMMFGDGLIKVNDGWRWSVMFDVGRGSFVIADPSAGCLCSQCHRDYPPLGQRKYQLSTRWWNRISCQLPGFSSFFRISMTII